MGVSGVLSLLWSYGLSGRGAQNLGNYRYESGSSLDTSFLGRRYTAAEQRVSLGIRVWNGKWEDWGQGTLYGIQYTHRERDRRL
ncbi:hypothetical protein B0T09DRAFT_336492 [Sordaria sp. MPI-SDFR-AT-0083]|nr:hypothetical protein B0T09DRAFT_336492 [Sordaria sp. MPI-SDFR-AT-0083]